MRDAHGTADKELDYTKLGHVIQAAHEEEIVGSQGGESLSTVGQRGGG